jgi:hypothetical protein
MPASPPPKIVSRSPPRRTIPEPPHILITGDEPDQYDEKGDGEFGPPDSFESRDVEESEFGPPEPIESGKVEDLMAKLIEAMHNSPDDVDNVAAPE